MSGLFVDGERIPASHVAFDGCHKFYLIASESHRTEIEGYGYGADDIHPVSELPRLWEGACFLRFIHWADLSDPDVVPQGREHEPVIEFR